VHRAVAARRDQRAVAARGLLGEARSVPGRGGRRPVELDPRVAQRAREARPVPARAAAPRGGVVDDEGAP